MPEETGGWRLGLKAYAAMRIPPSKLNEAYWALLREWTQKEALSANQLRRRLE
jgi:hypothetical protein